ncbi:MAG: exonuclease subunit SbcD, partial [Deinococcota bacterium]|nr:exonuclease subunit SbcD [Deinococcota bacterium]
MKILHTADWHAGRTLHGVDRTPEIREALREIAALAVDEEVDLILVAGDLYDSKRPGPEAEEAVYEFFLTTGRAGIPSVVIA